MLITRTTKLLLPIKIKLVTILLLIATGFVFAQENHLKIKFNPVFNKKVLEKNSWYVSSNNDSIQFLKITFYLTDFKILTKEGKTKSIPNSNFLVDVLNDENKNILLENVSYKKGDQLLFNIGVEEKMNTSGALSGALDPANGMYWSWQSGYINFKIEGKSPSCNTRKNKFQFHIGGYQLPFASTRSVTLNFSTTKNNVLKIDLNLGKLFNAISLDTLNQVMIPGKEAIQIADILPSLFLLNE
ncbi:MAG: hypothetical protein ACI93P_000110 [bacterium]|jgi:hypothetical protein